MQMQLQALPKGGIVRKRHQDIPRKSSFPPSVPGLFVASCNVKYREASATATDLDPRALSFDDVRTSRPVYADAKEMVT